MAAGDYRIGLEGKFYHGAEGGQAATEADNVDDVTLNLSKRVAEALRRGKKWVAKKPIANEASIEFKAFDIVADAFVAALESAYTNDTRIALYPTDGTGGKGLDADYYITQFQRQEDNEGTFTVAGHTFQVNDIVDIYWAGGVRYGMKVSAVNGNDFTAGGVGGPGAGDNLPAQEGTAIVADEEVEVDIDFDGDLMTLVVVHSPRRANVDFVDSGGTSLKVVRLTANEPWIWADGQGFTRPITGNPVDKAKVSNGDSQNPATLTIGVRLDSVS